MSKINVDEIQMGDIVEMIYDNTKWLCYVTDIDKAKGRVYGIWSDNFKEDWDYVSKLTGHWKVINFDELPESPYTEEEAKVDELKVYTGKETIEALLEGKTLQTDNGVMYKLDENIKVSHEKATGWVDGSYSIDYFIKNTFTEVATPQVGDWVKGSLGGKTQVGYVTDINEWYVYIDTPTHKTRIELKEDWQILSPEEVSEYKREQAFVKVGRKLNEFKRGDIVYIESVYRVAVVASNNNTSLINLHGINEEGKGYTAKPHQLTPIYFAENQVDLL